MIQSRKLGIVLEKRKLDFEMGSVLNPTVIYEGRLIHMLYRAGAMGNRGVIGYCNFIDPTKFNFRSNKPVIVPEFDYESHGVEDPRIVTIEETYFLTYSGFDAETAFG